MEFGRGGELEGVRGRADIAMAPKEVRLKDCSNASDSGRGGVALVLDTSSKVELEGVASRI